MLIHESGYPVLLQLVKELENRELQEMAITDLLVLAEEGNRLKDFKKIFLNYLILERFEKVLLLLSIINDEPLPVSIKSPELNRFFAANQLYNKGFYKEAAEVLKDFSFSFPRCYYYMLLRGGDYESALQFISKTSVKEKPFLEALAYYYRGDCDTVLNKLSATAETYEEKLLLTECGYKGDVLLTEKKEISKLGDDPFFIFREGKNIDKNELPALFQAYKSYYYSFRLKNYLSELSLYKEEIERFVSKMNELNLRLQQILKQYDVIWEKIEKGEVNRDIRNKVLEIYEKAKGLKSVTFRSSFREKDYLSFFEDKHSKNLILLDEGYKRVASKREDDQIRLKQEAEIREFLKDIENKEGFSDDILKKLSSYYDVALKKKLTVEEDLAYAGIYIKWNYFQNARGEDREKIIEEIKVDAEKYLKKYKARENQVTLILAEAYEETGDVFKALSSYESYLLMEKKPDARILMKMGELLFEKSRHEEAIRYFTDAANINAAYKNAAYYKIGWSYYLLGKMQEVAHLFMNYDFKTDDEKGLILFDEMMELLSKVFFKLGEDKINQYLSLYPAFSIPDRLFKGVGDLLLFLKEKKKLLL